MASVTFSQFGPALRAQAEEQNFASGAQSSMSLMLEWWDQVALQSSTLLQMQQA